MNYYYLVSTFRAVTILVNEVHAVMTQFGLTDSIILLID